MDRYPLQRQKKQLEKEREDIRRQMDKYKRMLFKPNIKPKKREEEIIEDDLSRARGRKTKRGGKKGHCGRGRKKTEKDRQVETGSCKTLPYMPE